MRDAAENTGRQAADANCAPGAARRAVGNRDTRPL